VPFLINRSYAMLPSLECPGIEHESHRLGRVTGSCGGLVILYKDDDK
jgi:hypothetical protein